MTHLHQKARDRRNDERLLRHLKHERIRQAYAGLFLIDLDARHLARRGGGNYDAAATTFPGQEDIGAVAHGLLREVRQVKLAVVLEVDTPWVEAAFSRVESALVNLAAHVEGVARPDGASLSAPQALSFSTDCERFELEFDELVVTARNLLEQFEQPI